MSAAKITLKEAEAIAYLLEHGRWPDAETGDWMQERTSQVALDYLKSWAVFSRQSAKKGG